MFIFYLLRLDFCRELRIYHQEGGSNELFRSFHCPSYPPTLPGENLGTRHPRRPRELTQGMTQGQFNSRDDRMFDTTNIPTIKLPLGLRGWNEVTTRKF